MGEKEYYPIIRKWLERKGYYCGGPDIVYKGTEKERVYENTGSLKSRVDVVGVKNVGNRFIDQIEIAAVEVKESSRITQKHIQQAYGYSAFAHQCYLATTANITDGDIHTAKRIGIGLIRLKNKTTKPKRVVTPCYIHTDEANMLEFLNSLWIGRCTICKCFFKILSDEDDPIGKTYYRFHRDLSFRKEGRGGKNDKIERYLCKDCLDEFFLEQKKLERLKRKMSK